MDEDEGRRLDFNYFIRALMDVPRTAVILGAGPLAATFYARPPARAREVSYVSEGGRPARPSAGAEWKGRKGGDVCNTYLVSSPDAVADERRSERERERMWNVTKTALLFPMKRCLPAPCRLPLACLFPARFMETEERRRPRFASVRGGPRGDSHVILMRPLETKGTPNADARASWDRSRLRRLRLLDSSLALPHYKWLSVRWIGWLNGRERNRLINERQEERGREVENGCEDGA